MPIECIRDQNSISFDTSTGSWEGPISWGTPWWSDQGGAGKIQVPGYGGIATITLGPPALMVYPPEDPEQTRWFWSGVAVAFDLPAMQISMKGKVTDGNYTYEVPWYTAYNAQQWYWYGAYGDIPKDWNNEGTTMQHFLQNNGIVEATVWVDGAHFYLEFGEVPPHPTPKRPQYLPIMGVG